MRDHKNIKYRWRAINFAKYKFRKIYILVFELKK
jgi:hypothetical protein